MSPKKSKIKLKVIPVKRNNKKISKKTSIKTSIKNGSNSSIKTNKKLGNMPLNK